jgi:hypothetical protein
MRSACVHVRIGEFAMFRLDETAIHSPSRMLVYLTAHFFRLVLRLTLSTSPPPVEVFSKNTLAVCSNNQSSQWHLNLKLLELLLDWPP